MLLVPLTPSASTLLPASDPARAADHTDASTCVARHRPDLPTTSSTFQAAVLLLAGRGLDFNIDLLTRRTGIARNRVAAVARRLFDNGVWSPRGDDRPWSGPADPRFWNDVAVAEGRLCRRHGEHGEVEWAPAGAWHKPYEYVDAPAPGLAVAYRAPDPAPAVPEPALRAAAAEERRQPASVPVRARSLPRPPRPLPAEPAGVLAGAGGGGWAPDLFPEARWLS